MARILYYSNHLRGPHGEAGARTWHQVKRLSVDYDVTVILPGVDPVTEKKVTPQTYAGLDIEKVEVVTIPTTKSDRSRRWRRALFFISAMAGQFWYGIKARKVDLVLSMSLPITQLLVAWVISILKQIPFGIDVRDFPMETALEVGYVRSKRLAHLVVKLETFLFKRAAFIVTNSPYYVEFLRERGIDGEKVMLAPIGYDDFAKSSSEEVNGWRHRIEQLMKPCSKDRFIGVYSGTLGYAFPLGAVMQAAARLKTRSEIGFVFVGDGQLYDSLRKDAQDKDLNIAFLGRQLKEDVHAICRSADFFIYPAAGGRFAGGILGNKVFDYLGAEKPILYLGGEAAVRDLIDELHAGLFCAHDADAFVENVLKLRSDKEMYERLSNNAKDYRNKGYTAEKSAEKLAALIDRCLGETASR